MWFQVMAAANGFHNGRGHATFGPGQLRAMLLTADRSTGEISEPAPATVSRAIKVCIERGLLGAASQSSCLVVPGHAISGGIGLAACKVHDRTRATSRKQAVSD
ncbi:hypothetical protein [Pengzhenrongella sicca]|uniref:Uncharacterized protein n=1 Tax=Pengzhenrongella sicca TaxID=2819238 RepID=A0A8A4ZEM1_9MICO|nr:hypothetical protein [Pengzhenrongella sicca]QTE30432.1 hypothetical protein J4E96_05430 [Pengzhenrongella sicca]